MVTAIDRVPAGPELDAAVVGILFGSAEHAAGLRPSHPQTADDFVFLAGCLVWLTQRPGGYVLPPCGSVAALALQVCRDVCRAAGLAGITVGVTPVEHPICIRCRERHAPEAYCQIREGLRRPQ